MLDFEQRPNIKEPETPEFYTCPRTGLKIPLLPAANAAYRDTVLAAAGGKDRWDAAQDDQLRPVVMRELRDCKASIPLFVAKYGYTVQQFSVIDGVSRQVESHCQPFIPHVFQLDLLEKFQTAMSDGKDLLVDKSRTLGLTWLACYAFVWRFLFYSGSSLLMLSYKEDVVDQISGTCKDYPNGGIGAEGTLLGKIDYILKYLPKWMVPYTLEKGKDTPSAKLYRKRLSIVNIDNGSRIDGESSNPNAGTGDRRTAILLDEFSKCEHAEKIKRSTHAVSLCRFVISTPNGRGTEFSKWALSGQIDRYTAYWWLDPGKAQGLRIEPNASGRYEVHSPWFDAEAARLSPKELAIEVNVDHVGADDAFMDNAVLADHRRTYGRTPAKTLTVGFQPELSEPAIKRALSSLHIPSLLVRPGGPLKVWENLSDELRLPQNYAYTLGVDISLGMGASNSVISVLCHDTHEKVAEWADANTPPFLFARITAAVAMWVGGRTRRPLIVFENNGNPAWDYGRVIAKELQYPHLYFDRSAGDLSEEPSKRYGWRSSREKKAELLGLLRRAYAKGMFINRSLASLDETMDYVNYPSGGIGPLKLFHESEAARQSHGDRTIADALSLWGASAENPRMRAPEEKPDNRTIAGRWRERKAAERPVAHNEPTFANMEQMLR